VNLFFDTLLTGILRSGAVSRFGALDSNYIHTTLLGENGLPAAFDSIQVQVPSSAQVPGWRPFYSRTAITRLLEALGSTTNPYPLTLLEAAANGVKGRLSANNNPRNLDQIRDLLNEAEHQGNETQFGQVWSHVAAASRNTSLGVVDLLTLSCAEDQQNV